MLLRPWTAIAKTCSPAVAIAAATLFLSGCGEADSGKQFSQDFEKPAGISEKVNPGAASSRSEERRKDIEESKQEAAKKSGKRR
jgi:hypothetical protein